MGLKNKFSDIISQHKEIIVYLLVALFAYWVGRVLVTSLRAWALTFMGLLFLIVIIKRFGIQGLMLIFAFAWWCKSVRYPTFITQLFSSLSTVDLLFIGLFLFWLFQVLVQRTNIFLSSPHLLYLTLFILFGAVALLTDISHNRGFAFDGFTHMCLFAPSIYIITANLFQDSKGVKRLITALFLGSIVYGGIIILGNLGYLPEVADYLYDIEHDFVDLRSLRLLNAFQVPIIGVVGISYNITASYFSMLIAFAFSVCLNSRKKIERILGFACVIVSYFVIFLLATRVALLSTIVASIIVIILSVVIGRIRIKRILAILGLAFIVWISAYMLFTFVSELTNKMLYERLLSLSAVDNIASDTAYLSRVAFLKSGLEAIFKYPLGTGFIRYLSDIGLIYYPIHNHFLSIAFGTGLAGLLIFLVFLAKSLRYIFVNFKLNDPLCTCLGIGTIAASAVYIINGISVDFIRNPGPNILLFMLLGLSVAAIKFSNAH